MPPPSAGGCSRLHRRKLHRQTQRKTGIGERKRERAAGKRPLLIRIDPLIHAASALLSHLLTIPVQRDTMSCGTGRADMFLLTQMCLSEQRAAEAPLRTGPSDQVLVLILSLVPFQASCLLRLALVF